MSAAQIIQGDCMEVLPTLPAKSVQCCVTSPPYFALRSYLPAGHELKGKEIGSEPTPEAFIATMVDVFRQVRRVLRDDGVLFVNLGDSYANDGSRNNGTGLDGKRRGGVQSTDGTWADAIGTFGGDRRKMAREAGYSHGDLMNIPHRVAEALRQDGWIWRQTIVWAKRSPMPESVSGWRWVRCGKRSWPDAVTNADEELRRDRQQGRDFGTPMFVPCPGCPKCEKHGGYVLRKGSGRCTTAHEFIFIFAKSMPYFWDSAASAETAVGNAPGNRNHKAADGYGMSGAKHNVVGLAQIGAVEQRNPRSVWTLSSEPTKVRHFATYPSELVRRCLVAGVSAGGCCPVCEAPFAPVMESERVATRPGLDNKIWKHDDGDKVGQRSESSPNLDPQRHIAINKCHGYRPTCDCGRADAIGCMVLDPFNGIGTTGQTALALGCRYVGIELNPEYAEVARRRIHETPRWMLRQGKVKPMARQTATAALFE